MFDTKTLESLLLDQHYVTKKDTTAAREYEKNGKGTFLDYMLQMGILSKSVLGAAIAEYHNVSFVDLSNRTPHQETLDIIDEKVAHKHQVVPVTATSKRVDFATSSLETKKIQKALKKLLPDKEVSVGFAFPEEVAVVLAFYEAELSTRFSKIIEESRTVAPDIFGEIIKDALRYKASDIHFEPTADKSFIRFRIDGMLHLAGSVHSDLYANIVNRIKIQAQLRIDEHFLPQDGAIRFVYDETNLDLRVSVVPTLNGEKIVIRVLAEYVAGLSYDDLGFNQHHRELLKQASHKPFGMVLVAGPTGAGKTTTLYSIIKTINSPEINVMTVEDPVEYRMLGTNQMQVHSKIGLTFAKGLRSIVRQDPNIILVGEIRDTETVETAVNAALTGHLLFSTFHANNSATCIPRLIDMGVEPFLLASTLELIIAQRLARRICESCRHSVSYSKAKLKKDFPRAASYFKQKNITLYQSKGCAACNHTGYQGRIAVVEMIQVTDKIKEAISTEASSGELWKVAASEGAVSMFEDGLEKVRLGVTTLEEVIRVAPPPLT